MDAQYTEGTKLYAPILTYKVENCENRERSEVGTIGYAKVYVGVYTPPSKAHPLA